MNMKPLSQSYNLAIVLVGTAVIGLMLSMALTTDPRWMSWHLSRLGEGGQVSAMVFNGTLLVVAVLLILIALRLTSEIRSHKPTESTAYLRSVLLLTALCWVGLALFPFDRSHVVHRIFGYGQMGFICLLMLTLKRRNTPFSDRTHAIGLFGVIITGSLLALYHLIGVPGLVIVELSGQVVLFVWLLSLTRDMHLRKI